ncbi:MAG: 4Fe-4S binding protein [Candidatus Helarchaeota archaeon]
MQTETEQEAQETRVYRPKVNMRLCIGCGDCVAACPTNKTADLGIVEDRTILSVENGILVIKNIYLCDGCGLCIEACLPKAISIEFPVQEETK